MSKAEEFLKLIKQNNQEAMKMFLLENSKKAKPHCPFYFDNLEDSKGEEANGRETDNGKLNE